MMEENIIVIRDNKTFYFHFDRSKNVYGNLKHLIECNGESSGSLGEN